jgi:hypothetical protein
VLLFTLGLSLFSLHSRDLVVHLLGAARFGLGATLAWWIVQGLRGVRGPRDPDTSRVNVPPTVLPGNP